MAHTNTHTTKKRKEEEPKDRAPSLSLSLPLFSQSNSHPCQDSTPWCPRTSQHSGPPSLLILSSPILFAFSERRYTLRCVCVCVKNSPGLPCENTHQPTSVKGKGPPTPSGSVCFLRQPFRCTEFEFSALLLAASLFLFLFYFPTS